MLLHLALVEDDGLPRVQPAGDVGGRHLKDGLVQLGRVLPQGDGVKINHAIDAFMALLQLDPVHHGAKIIAKVQVAGRLHARKNAFGKSHRLVP